MGKGIRFWLPSVVYHPGFPATKSDDPWAGIPGEITLYNIDGVPGGKLFFRGEIIVEDPIVIREIINRPATGIKFNPQEIVDAGIATAEELRSKGYKVQDRPDVKPVAVKDDKKIPLDIPDFDTMSKVEILDWALGRGLVISGERSKPYIVEQIKKQLAKERRK